MNKYNYMFYNLYVKLKFKFITVLQYHTKIVLFVSYNYWIKIMNTKK